MEKNNTSRISGGLGDKSGWTNAQVPGLFPPSYKGVNGGQSTGLGDWSLSNERRCSPLFRRLTSCSSRLVLHQAESEAAISAAQPLPPAGIPFCLIKHDNTIGSRMAHIEQHGLHD
jgi:hypothetical protein